MPIAVTDMNLFGVHEPSLHDSPPVEVVDDTFAVEIERFERVVAVAGDAN